MNCFSACEVERSYLGFCQRHKITMCIHCGNLFKSSEICTHSSSTAYTKEGYRHKDR